MTLSAIRTAARSRTVAVRTVLLSLIGVGAIVVGLLMLHSFSLDESPASPAAAVSPATTPAGETARSAEQPAAPDDCGLSGCDPAHTVGFLACLLAVMVVSLIPVAAPHMSRWLTNLWAQSPSLLYALRAAVPAPPSLIALSISRT